MNKETLPFCVFCFIQQLSCPPFHFHADQLAPVVIEAQASIMLSTQRRH